MRASFLLCVVAIVGWTACGSGDPGDPALLENGTDCRGGHECRSGHCVGRMCCDTACTDACSVCWQQDHYGSCTPLPAEDACWVQ